MTIAQLATEENSFQETKSRLFWVGLIVGLLVLQICIGGLAVVLATGNPAVGVVDDYYQQGLSWDEHQAAQLKSEALKWHLTDLSVDKGDVFGNRELQFKLLDQENRPVTGCTLNTKVYFHAAANKVLSPQFTESSPGLYQTNIQMRRTGLWALKIEAENDSGTFYHTEDFRLKQEGTD